MMKKMNVLVASLVILTPWITLSMEPEVMSTEATLETVAGPEGSWVRFFDETVPGYRSPKTGFHPQGDITRVLAQEVLRKRPQMREYILSQIAVPFIECVGHGLYVTSAEFNRTGDKVVTASGDGKAKIWDTAKGRTLHTLIGHIRQACPVVSAAFNSTGDKVVTASSDRTAKIWETETGRHLHTLEGHTSVLRLAVFNPTGDNVVTVSWDRTAKIWNTADGSLLHTLEGHTDCVFSAVFNQTGDKVVTVSNDRTMRIWNAADGRHLHTLEGCHEDDGVPGFNTTGDIVVIPSAEDGTAILRETETGSPLHTLRGHTAGYTFSAAFNPTGDKVVTASSDGTAKIWETETGRHLHTLEGHTDVLCSAAFNSAGDKVVTTSADRTARIWDLGGLLEIETFLAEDIMLQQVALLLDIFEVMTARHYLPILKREAPGKVTSLRRKDITFDFNRYPDLWDDYEKLPEAMRTMFDSYITKPSLERDLKRLSNAEEQL